jgi:divalent metal cation (Fe/Co/Zn/Cd) transporter
MYFVNRFNNNLPKQIGSKALYSAAQENRSDALVSIGTVVGNTETYLFAVWLDLITAGICWNYY